MAAQGDPLLPQNQVQTRNANGAHEQNSRQDLESQRSGRYEDEDPASDHNSNSDKSSDSWVSGRMVSDAILGLSDGLTVPFALTAGLSALGNAKVVIFGGLAELAAGAISMGLGGYVGEQSEVESYQTSVRKTMAIIENEPQRAKTMVQETLAQYNLPQESVHTIINTLHQSDQRLRDFLLKFHEEEKAPQSSQAWISAITLALGYFVGGFIPLIPYFIADQVLVALYWSIGVMAVTLFVFGYVKACVVRGWRGKENVFAGLKGAVQMCIVGGLAAGASAALVRLIDKGKGGSG